MLDPKQRQRFLGDSRARIGIGIVVVMALAATLAPLIARLMARRREDRYSNARELLRDLRLAERTLEAMPVPRIQRRVPPLPLRTTGSLGRGFLRLLARRLNQD